MTTATATSWIEHAPDVCGGEARIRETRITVHGLVQWKRLGLSDEQLLSDFPGLTQEDLQAARWYYANHQDEIDRAIQQEEASNANGPSLRR
jgi:uncharacterized protein (DUF433 family)